MRCTSNHCRSRRRLKPCRDPLIRAAISVLKGGATSINRHALRACLTFTTCSVLTLTRTRFATHHDLNGGQVDQIFAHFNSVWAARRDRAAANWVRLSGLAKTVDYRAHVWLVQSLTLILSSRLSLGPLKHEHVAPPGAQAEAMPTLQCLAQLLDAHPPPIQHH
jgi:hypothetical protein